MATHDQLGIPRSAFNQQSFEDPYLSGPSDLEDFPLEQHTPSASSVERSSRSPAENQPPSHPQHPSYGLQQDSFDESRFIGFSQGSVDHLFFDDVIAEDSNVDSSTHTHTETHLAGDALAQSTFYSHPANMSGQPNVMPTGIEAHQPSRLTIPDNTWDFNRSPVDSQAASIPSPSPVVKVSQVHRGDSPTRDDNEWTGRRSKRSSAHLESPSSYDHTDEFINDDEKPSVSPSRSEDGSWVRDAATGQAGLDPYARSNEYISSPKDMEEARQRAERNIDIQIWSVSVSAANSEAGDEPSSSEQLRTRPRAVSAVQTRPDYFGIMRPDDSLIPGPGLLIYEPDPGSDFDASSEMSHTESLDGLPPLKLTLQNEPLGRQLNRSYPWKDTPQFPFPVAIKTQPESSSAAMKRYEDLAKELETASRVGTWGSKRLNDAEVDSLLQSDSFFKSLSISKASIRNFLSKRSSGSSKDKKRHSFRLSRQSSFEEEKPSDQDHKKESSISSKLTRRTSQNRPKPSSILAVAAIPGQVAGVIGSHNSLSANKSVSPRSPFGSAPWNRNRSKSDTGPLPIIDIKPLAISPSERKPVLSQKPSPVADSGLSGVDGEDDEDDDSADERGIVMNLAPSSQQIVPTFEGFKRQISSLDPRLEPALVDRFAREQLRRYAKLIGDYDKHAALVQEGKCDARERCFASGGRAKLLPPRANARDPKANYCQFQIPGHENSDHEGHGEEGNNAIDNVIPAVFAEGIRLPPVKLLPAEFECTLCFKTKKCQKPSDWTKHIYEDICPFTCTFPNCNEPKSFKRKADWVRHETERHRHLEWWACNTPKCDHVCFRKNNFVQHLVREHGKPDPKTRSGSNAGEEITKLVNECRHETTGRPEDEPCRFCGNISKDWRKLMVHLARHMERIALPVLRLAEEYSAQPTIYSHNRATTPPSISVYGSAESSAAASNAHIAGIGEPTVTNEVQLAYQAQPVTHMLSPSAIGPSGLTYPPATSYLQPNYTPGHRNSLSYPPSPVSHSPTTRQPTSISSMGPTYGTVSAAPFQLNITTMGADDAQQPLYQSPQDTCMYADELFPSTYNNTGIANPDFPITASPETDMDPTNARAYLTQIQDNNYQSAPYNYR